MLLKTVLLAATATIALAAFAVQAHEPGKTVEEAQVVFVDGDAGHAGHPAHCQKIVMMMSGDDAMAAHHHDPHAVITREEFSRMHMSMFDAMDLNHDGKLDPDEIAKAHSAHSEDCSHDMPPMGEMHIEHLEHHGEGDDHHVEMRVTKEGGFEGADLNHDGKISFDEFAAPLRQAFDAIDKDHSGFIEKSEFEKGVHMEIRVEADHH